MALIDTTGSASDADIELHLLSALRLAGNAGGWFAFYDNQLRSEPQGLTALNVANTIAIGQYPGRGGDDLKAVASEAFKWMESQRIDAPLRVVFFSDMLLEIPPLKDLSRGQEGDEFYLCGDCKGAGLSQTDPIMERMKLKHDDAIFPKLIDSTHLSLAYASLEAREIGRSASPGKPADKRWI